MLKRHDKSRTNKCTAFISNGFTIYSFANYALKASLICSINLVVDLEKT